MKVVIFASDLGTRIYEETDTRPIPMFEIGSNPTYGMIRNYPSIRGLMNSLFAFDTKLM